MKAAVIKLLMVTAAILAPAKAMLLTALCLILVDLVTGVLAARKQGIPITSAGLRRTITKLFVYELVLVLGFLCEQYLSGPAMPVAHIIAGYIGLTEMLSCLENINILSGNDLLKAILDKLNSSNK